MARDVDIGRPEHETINPDNAIVGGLEDVYKRLSLLSIGRLVSCPAEPLVIPGVGTAAVYAGTAAIPECLGTIAILTVPKSGVIYSATFYDIDDEGSQVDLEIFKRPITQVADNAAWTLSAANNPAFVTEIQFFAFDDQIASQTSEVKNIGKAYNAPNGLFYIQAITRGTPTIAIGAIPRFQLQIQSFDPSFEI